MKKLLFLSAVVALAVIPTPPIRGADCQTLVSGIIDGEVWTAAGSPYCVNGDVMVSSLVIQAGVEIRFLSNYVFMVDGVLQVKGTAGNEVRFTTTNAAVGWQGIWFFDALPGSFFNNCIIENSKNSGVRITNGPPTGGAVPAFTNCMIINNSSPDFGGGIDATLRSGDLILDNCLIRSNTCRIHGGGINAILTTGTLKMVGCTVVSNIANVAQSFGGYVGGGVRVSGHSVLLNCFVGDNLSRGHYLFNTSCGNSYGGGIYSDTGDATFRNCRFQRNTADTLSQGSANSVCSFSRGGGVYFRDGHLTMQNCIVDTNTCSGAYHDNQGAGICVESGTADIINCSIVANNTTGIYRTGGSVNCLNSILFLNNSSAAQIGGSVTATYSDIQGGYPGDGNKAVNPNLRPGTLELLSISPCIDMGNPDPIYYDLCFPPSRGTATNDMGAYGGSGACDWGTPPVVTQPQRIVTCFGQSVTLCANASGSAPLTYQWRYHGTNANGTPVNIAGATTNCLTLVNVQAGDTGYYSVLVTNPFGSANDAQTLLLVSPACVSIQLYPGLSITGLVGQAYCIQYTTDVSSNPAWTSLTNFALNTPSYFYLDPHPATLPRRFYRVIEGSCP